MLVRKTLPGPLRQVILALPAVVVTVLLTPNLVLAYLGTGVADMSLVTILFGMLLGLWSPAIKSVAFIN